MALYFNRGSLCWVRTLSGPITPIDPPPLGYPVPGERSLAAIPAVITWCYPYEPLPWINAVGFAPGGGLVNIIRIQYRYSLRLPGDPLTNQYFNFYPPGDDYSEPRLGEACRVSILNKTPVERLAGRIVKKYPNTADAHGNNHTCDVIAWRPGNNIPFLIKGARSFYSFFTPTGWVKPPTVNVLYNADPGDMNPADPVNHIGRAIQRTFRVVPTPYGGQTVYTGQVMAYEPCGNNPHCRVKGVWFHPGSGAYRDPPGPGQGFQLAQADPRWWLSRNSYPTANPFYSFATLG